MCIQLSQAHSRRVSKYIQWMAESAKTSFLRGSTYLQALDQTIPEIENILPKKRRRLDRAPTAGAVSSSSQAPQSLPTFHLDPMLSQESFQRSFEADIMRLGKVWLLEDSIDRIVVVWNACSAEHCKLSRSEFCTTTMFRDDVANSTEGSCDNCLIYKSTTSQRASTLRTEITSLPPCPHMAMRPIALQAVESRQSVESSRFETYLRQSFDSTVPVSSYTSSSTKCQYFVVCPKARADAGELSLRYGVVTIEVARTSGEVFVSCANTHCRRCDRKAMKNPREFCPHFETLWRDPIVTSEIRSTLGVHSWGLGDDQCSGSEPDVDPDLELVQLDREAILEADLVPGLGENEDDESWKTSVIFNKQTGLWQPSGNLPFAVIPITPTEFTRKWSDLRASGSTLHRNTNQELQWYDGSSMLVLRDTRSCVPTAPSECSLCGLSNFERQDDGSLLIRTSLGCVQRARERIQCSTKGESSFFVTSSRSLSLPVALQLDHSSSLSVRCCHMSLCDTSCHFLTLHVTL